MRIREIRSTKTKDLEISGYKYVLHKQATNNHAKEEGVMQ